uniref:TSA: Wollemia nobilis Ref_Wollemi_Transcript_11543_2378 transcribed RNA sequence n=1 Tax=Wollemia nobilis TaxID=56998 RepID=A0A0C9S8D1_9CONI
MAAGVANGALEADGSVKDLRQAVSNGKAEVNHGHENGSISNKKLKEIERRRRRRKQKKKNRAAEENGAQSENDSESEDKEDNGKKDNKLLEQVEVEYVPEKANLEDEILEEFRHVFEKFRFGDGMGTGNKDDEEKQDATSNLATKKKVDSDSDEEDEQEKQNKEKGISNKKKKLQRRMGIAELKQMCSRPDVVEVWDATAADPKLLVYLKSYRNTVPVPRHWCQKRKFLQGKRGIEKQPFQLPDFIAATGIEKNTAGIH